MFDFEDALLCILNQPLLLLFSISLLPLLRLLLPPAEGCSDRLPGWVETRCAVCLDDIFSNKEAEKSFQVLLECGHGFHAGCIDRWIRCRQSCPLCRRAVAGGRRRSYRERVLAALLSRFCRWMDSQFDSQLTLLLCQNL